MTALTWLLLGLGVLLLPAVDPAATRARLLTCARPAGRGADRVRFARAAAPSGARRDPGLRGGRPSRCSAWAGPVLAAATGIGSATLARLVLVALRGRAARRREAELTSAVRLIAAELESGQPALGRIHRGSAARRPTWRARVRQPPPRRVTPGTTRRSTAAELRGLGDAWRVADRAGAPLAAVVRRVADDLAARVEQRQAVTAAVAGARSSAALLAGLPLLGLLLGAAMQAHPLDVLLTTRAGQLVCLLGVALDAAGVLWTQRLAARAERA